MGRIGLHANDHVLGSRDTASVELIMYGDYQCPYSARGIGLVTEMLDRIGDALLFAFRNFPLVHRHPHAFDAALAAEAADRQGRFWDMHLELFRNQRALDAESLLAYAARLGLDDKRFTNDLASDQTRRRVLMDRESGEKLGVGSTPTFFVNGEKYDGPVAGITSVVEEAVTKTSAPGAGYP